MKHARDESESIKKLIVIKNREKVNTLKQRSKMKRNSEEERRRRQQAIGDFADMDIFVDSDDNETHEESDDTAPEVLAIDVDLDEEEKAALRLPPKTSVLNNLSSDTFDLEMEVSNTKLRYDMLKNPKDSDDDAENGNDSSKKEKEQTEEEILDEEKYEDLVEMLDAESRETFRQEKPNCRYEEEESH